MAHYPREGPLWGWTVLGTVHCMLVQTALFGMRTHTHAVPITFQTPDGPPGMPLKMIRQYRTYHRYLAVGNFERARLRAMPQRSWLAYHNTCSNLTLQPLQAACRASVTRGDCLARARGSYPRVPLILFNEPGSASISHKVFQHAKYDANLHTNTERQDHHPGGGVQ